MTSSLCPICGKAVDTLRSRHAGVRDGKVVAYCSADCAAKASFEQSRPVSVKVRTPASGIAVTIPTSPDSGPIIEIIREGSVPTKVPPAEGEPSKRAGSTGGHKRLDTQPNPVLVAKRQAELAAAADADDDEEINGEDAPPAEEPKKRPVALILVVVLVLAGGVALAVKLLSHGSPASAAPAATEHVPPTSAR